MTDRASKRLQAVGAQLDQLIGPARGDARKLAALALTAEECGRTDLIYPLASSARALAPRDPEILALTQRGIAFGVQRWHVHMLRDEERHDRYRAAIERTVQPGDRVLDIGSGTGLLAMIAARAGAAHVFSCEAVPAIADVAREIVALNGFADRVTIISRRSSDLDPVIDLAGPVDVVISEVIASNLIGENVLPTVDDAVRRLLRSGGRMLPLTGDVVVALADIGSPDRRRIEVGGFDLSMIRRLSRQPEIIDVGSRDIVLRSEPIDLYSFDFTRGAPWGDPRTTSCLTADGGSVNGVLMWMRITIDDVETYESRPVPDRVSSWVTLFYRLDEPRQFVGGQPVTVEAIRRAGSIHLWVSETSVPPLE